MAKKIKQEIFLDNLPRYINGKYVGKIYWMKTIGQKVKGIYDNLEFEVEIMDYNSKGQILTIKYMNDILNMSTGNFSKCRFGKILGKRTVDFKIEIGQVFKDDKRNITIIDREYRPEERTDNRKCEYIVNLKYYKYHCNICRYEGWALEGCFKNTGCSCCSGQTLAEGINDVATVSPWIVKYFQGGYEEAKLYTKWGSGNPNNKEGKIYPICPECGRIKNKKISIGSIYSCHSIGCHCSDGASYPNKFAFEMLKELKLDFVPEYAPEWINPKSYDFYFKLNNKEYILEMDGGFHSKDNNMSGQTAEESKAIDDYKDEKANIHGIEVIRIDCFLSNFDYIKQYILNSRLNELFDLSKIDWLKVEEFALSNRVREACELWNGGIHRTDEIGEIMKIKGQTVCRYLKKGKLLNWCNYDPQLVIRKKAKRPKIKNIEIFKNDISLGIFKSGKEIEEKSEKLFGIKLLRESIYKVCNEKIVQYKGFIFKYM